MTNDQRESRIKELFNDALELDQDERVAFLDRAADDPSIRIDVRVMIEAHDRAGDFLANPEIDGFDRPGEIIGRYKLQSVIGEGGFGRVYLAEQREPVIRNVALKIIKLGMDTRQVIARFEAERQALAMMDHPNIASVFDAGATTTGRPYFVMELVDGVPITDYCDQNRLSVVQRIELFRQVCSAVQHAHTKGVIHRDIKPNNVLVSNGNERDRPCPKVIDFGIAKATGARLADETVITEVRHLIGTPEYMSPEQAGVNAADIDTRSDIYSLGVLLYELLVGATPFDGKRLRSSTFGEWQRIIREEEPPKPSTRLSALETRTGIAAQRAMEPRRLTAQLRGDLDWITLKALEKNRDGRYGSAAELADDLRRHLGNEPVLAGPPGATYRVKKFVRRHRIGVLAASLVALAVACGAIGTTIGMLRARDSALRATESAQQASATDDFMREVLTSADPDQRGADVKLVEVLATATSEASLRFAGRPQLEAPVRDLLGDVYGRLSMWKRAEDEYRKAMNLWGSWAGPDDPRTLSSTVSVGRSLVSQERGRDAEVILDGILPRLDRVFGPDHEKSLEGRGVVADVLRARGRLDQGRQLVRAALDRAALVGAPEPLQLRLLNTLTGILRQTINSTDSSAREAAIDACRESASQLLERGLRARGRGIWFTMTARQNLAELALMRDQFDEAKTQSRLLLEESRDRLGECHSICIAAMMVLARAEYGLGETHEPADLFLQMIACVRANSGSDSIRLLADLTDALAFLDRDARWKEGEACAREAMQTLQALSGEHVNTYFYEVCLASFISNQGRLDESEQLFQSLTARRAEADRQSWVLLEVRYADHLIRSNRFEQAEERLKNFQTVGDTQGGLSRDDRDALLAEFITLYEAWNKPDKVEEYRRLRDAANH